jgi:flagellar biosynthesis protein FlhF
MAADAAERPLGAKEPALRVGSTRLEPDTARAPFERPKTKSEPAPLSAGAGSSPIDQILSEVRQELKGMRDMFNERLPVGATSLASNDRPVDGLAAKLAGLGFSTSLAHDVASGVRGDGDSKAVLATALERIAGRLTVAGGDAIDTAGVVALIGPTGVGKTTTLGKLAADFVLRHGGAELGLVTVDSYRIAAHEQLRTYGRLLGAPVRTAASSDELSRVLYDFRHKRLVLIDTTGMSQRDPRLNEQLSWLGEAGQPIQLYLTVSCATQSGAIAQVFNAYRSYGPAACVLTKLDEAVSYGAAISALIEHRLPLAYVCNGQRVPEDLHVGDADALLALCNAPPGASSTVPREFQAGERRMAHAYA